MTRPRLHLVGLPHTTTTDDITVCAYTARGTKFCRMMDDWDITLYWGDRSDVQVTELVTLHSEEERQAWYPGLNPGTVATLGGGWDHTHEPWRVLNQRAIAELALRVAPEDLILLTGGWASHPIAHAFKDRIVCEYGVGYSGWFTEYCCFESHAWRHHCYGAKQVNDGRFYDTVIPNYFDPLDLPLTESKDDYLLFVGRLIRKKGVEVAAEIAKRVGMRLLVAGSGAAEVSEGLIVCEDGARMEGDVHYIGTVGVEERAELMGKARALLCPTLYVEPFGGVAVEAQFCGTPAISTNWGAFVETVDPQFRFNTLADSEVCIETALEANPLSLRERAMASWSFDAVRPRYARWFRQLAGLWNGGWYGAS